MGKLAKRLYAEFHPEHYDISLILDKQKMYFTGSVIITGQKAGRPSQRMTFHQNGLKITSASITFHDKKGDSGAAVDRINSHRSYDEVRIHTAEKLFPGKYTVKMEFEGKITTPMHGIYPCFFKYKGEDKVILATQFESHHARQAFPCIDEPEAKATFRLSLIHPANETALSNTPAAKQEKLPPVNQAAKRHKAGVVPHALLRTEFELTPRMSTYLLAFVIGELHSVKKTTKDGVVVQSWSSIAQPKNHLEYSVNEAVRLLEFFSDYFGQPYPLQKCDQVALPDFDSGAMENWGLITYREVALLADPKNRSVSNEQYISLVVAHELSHQWFGNLVTMKWWDDLWLNESFASLMEHLALDVMHPDWQQWETFTTSDVVSTSSRDVYSDIQPVGVKVTDPDLLPTLFDPGIVYAKGARLLKMLREYVGDEVFKTGLRSYFKRHAYKNAVRNDLWNALSEASGKDISAVMTPWLSQPGMPVVSVTQNGTKLHLSQKRFLLDKESDRTVWPIPLLSGSRLNPDLFDTRSINIILEDPALVQVNPRGSGHYFVHYTEASHRTDIRQTVKSRALPPEARINALNDLYMLARHGDLSITDALDLVGDCSEEPRDSVWSLMLRVISAARQLTEGDEVSEENIKKLKTSLTRTWYQKLGWDDGPKDDTNTKQLRHTAVSMMVGGEDKTAIDIALKHYGKSSSLSEIHAELRSTILGANVRYNNKSETVINRLIKDYGSAAPDLQVDITHALANTRDGQQASIILGKALGKNGFVRPQDTIRWIAMFIRNYYIRNETWEFLTSNWEHIQSVLEHSKSYDYLPVYCANVISTEEWGKKFHSFFEPLKDNKLLQRNIQVGSADIIARIAWRRRDEAKVRKWLTAYNKS